MICTCPRIVVAGTKSGVGKTSVTLAFVAALKKRGLRVQTFKVGPDYLDPIHLAAASGRPCYNLDSWMTDNKYLVRLFARAASDADIAVIEGVMGLYDGVSPTSSQASTAEVAKVLKAPVLLVVDAHGAARSVAAMVKGYSDFESGVTIAGVIANRVGSKNHEDWIAASLESSECPPFVGAVLRGGFPELPSRHLGLVQPDKGRSSSDLMTELADAFERYTSIKKILEFAKKVPDLEYTEAKINHHDSSVRIGVAFDEAFNFYYQDLFDELELRGCELIRFSPMSDSCLPQRLDALYLGGGYPEVHAEILSKNQGMLKEIRTFASSGKPVYAECGGLIYLSQGVETLEEKRYSFTGCIPAAAKMLKRRKTLGYMEITLTDETFLGESGRKLRGHEFHYSELIEDPIGKDGCKSAYEVRHNKTDRVFREGYNKGNVLASYIHLHLASHPDVLDRFVLAAEACPTEMPLGYRGTEWKDYFRGK